MSAFQPGLYRRWVPRSGPNLPHFPWRGVIPGGGIPDLWHLPLVEADPDAARLPIPAEVRDLLRVESWSLTASFSDPDPTEFSGDLSRTLSADFNAGTIVDERSGEDVAYEPGVSIINDPGWANIDEAITGYFGTWIAGARLYEEATIGEGELEANWEVALLIGYPRLHLHSTYGLYWTLPLWGDTQWGSFAAASYELPQYRDHSLTALGTPIATIEEDDEDESTQGWSITLDVGTYF